MKERKKQNKDGILGEKIGGRVYCVIHAVNEARHGLPTSFAQVVPDIDISSRIDIGIIIGIGNGLVLIKGELDYAALFPRYQEPKYTEDPKHLILLVSSYLHHPRHRAPRVTP